MKIDLRSDTVTLPTEAMREAMQNAPLGDDVFGEDPSINALQEKAADMFQMEAALFCPSGTMANQIAINVHTRPGDEVICSALSHIYLYEGGGIARNSGASVSLLNAPHGILDTDAILNAIRPDDAHHPVSTLVALENTCNKGGGSVYPLERIQEISAAVHAKGLQLHLDGARLFNAFRAGGYGPTDMGAQFDSISICLSKGLGAPVGSVLLGDKAFIKKAHRVRKALGGGMRQAGGLAAAGTYALDHHVERLDKDHAHARTIASTLENCSLVKGIDPVETNIIIFQLVEGTTPDVILEKLKEHNVHAVPFGPDKIRFVFHLNVDTKMVDQLMEILPQVLDQ